MNKNMMMMMMGMHKCVKKRIILSSLLSEANCQICFVCIVVIDNCMQQYLYLHFFLKYYPYPFYFILIFHLHLHIFSFPKWKKCLVFDLLQSLGENNGTAEQKVALIKLFICLKCSSFVCSSK